MISYTLDGNGHLVITDSDTGKTESMPCCEKSPFLIRKETHQQRSNDNYFFVSKLPHYDLLSICRTEHDGDKDVVIGFTRRNSDYRIELKESPGSSRQAEYLEIWVNTEV